MEVDLVGESNNVCIYNKCDVYRQIGVISLIMWAVTIKYQLHFMLVFLFLFMIVVQNLSTPKFVLSILKYINSPT